MTEQSHRPMHFNQELLFKTDLASRWRRTLLPRSGKRLASTLQAYASEMAQLESKAALNAAHMPIFQHLHDQVTRSAIALESGDLELGWELFNTARRSEAQLYHALSQGNSDMKEFGEGMFRGVAACVLAEGNKKLGGWRKGVLLHCLTGEGEQIKTPLALSDVLQAQQILAEHHTNVYRRLSIIGDQIRYLELIAVLSLLGWLVFLANVSTFYEPQEQAYRLSLTIPTLLFGILGACISGIFQLQKGAAQQNIPEQMLNFVFTIARPLVGAISALAVVVFVLAGILELGAQTPGIYLAAAFAAGFSERLLQKGLTGAEDGKKA